MKPRVKFGMVIAVVVATIGYLMYVGLQAGSMYYLTISELNERQEDLRGERVRVHGNLVVGSVQFDAESLDLAFVLQDEDSSATLPVSYHGAPPDLIEEEGVSLVVEGYYDRQLKTFDAKTLLVKCPSKYEKEAEETGGREASG